ncbi:MAG: DcaP family trimeric outer membrane transporter [Prevotella sp.]|nr:DcaP family trimeric outer membrane transporter [Prevotella sp.]
MKYLAYILSLIFTLTAYANPNHGYKITNKHITTDLLLEDSLKNAMVANAPNEFSQTPNFIFSSSNNMFALSIGGFLKATASFDFGAPTGDPTDFLVSQIPVPNPKGNGAVTQFSAQASSLYTNFIFNPGNHQAGAFIGINLTGGNYAPSIQYAYVRYRGFQAGYDETLFCDPGAAPPSIDDEGPNALCDVHNTGIRYIHSWGANKHCSAGVAFELPIPSFINSDKTRDVSQRIPDIPAFIRYSWDNNSSWVRLSGILRNIAYRDIPAERNRYATGWGFTLSGSASLIPSRLSTIWHATYGQGIASYFCDLNSLESDMFPSSKSDGKLLPADSWGIVAGFQYNFSEKLYSSITYSQLRIYDHKATAPKTAYRYGQYILANLFYNFNNALSWGIEYIYGRRMNFDSAQNHDNRIQTMLQLQF